MADPILFVRRVASFGLPHGDGEITALSVPEESWSALLVALVGQRLTGLAVAGAERGWLRLSSAQEEELLARHRDAMLQALGLERILVGVSGAFEEAGVEMVVLKGPALAHTVYPDPSWRPFSDLDLLVRGRDWRLACEILTDGGFRRGLPEPRAGFDVRFGKAAEFAGPGGLMVDLHRTLVVGPFGLWMDPGELFERTARFSVGGRSLRLLDGSSLLLHQCMHASLGWWPPLLMPVRDVAQVSLLGDVDWALLAERAQRWRLTAVVRHALEMASDTLGTSFPEGATSVMAIEPGRKERRALDAYITDRRNRGGTSVSTLRAIPGLRAKAAYVRALVFPSRDFLAARQGNGRLSYLRRLTIPIRWLAGRRSSS